MILFLGTLQERRKKVMAKSMQTLLFEAVFVGAFLIVFYELVKFVLSSMLRKEQPLYLHLMLTGIAFHLVFEYTGLNSWYSVEYVKGMK